MAGRESGSAGEAGAWAGGGGTLFKNRAPNRPISIAGTERELPAGLNVDKCSVLAWGKETFQPCGGLTNDSSSIDPMSLK